MTTTQYSEKLYTRVSLSNLWSPFIPSYVKSAFNRHEKTLFNRTSGLDFTRKPVDLLVLTDLNEGHICGFGILSYLDSSQFDPSCGGWEYAAQLIDYPQHQPSSTSIPCAFFINVNHAYRGRGIASLLIKSFKDRAQSLGQNNLFIPLLLPSSTAFKYCTMDISSYASNTDSHGLYSDYWLRTHQRCGAELISVFHASHNYVIESRDYISAIRNCSIIPYSTSNGYQVCEYQNRFYCLKPSTHGYEVTVPCAWVKYAL